MDSTPATSALPTILIVGGTGMFGKRLVKHLAMTNDLNAQLIITSRSSAKAEDIANDIKTKHPDASIRGIAFDRDKDIAAIFADLNPKIVVDCSGPFQSADYELALAAIECGSNFIDLADAKNYIENFTHALDLIASESNLTAITGASATPALSANVVGEITNGWQRIDKIELAITPGGKSEVGLSVMQALLSYAGRKIPAWKDGKSTSIYGLINSKVIDVPNLGKRRIVPVETIDAVYLGQRYKVASEVIFYTGLESAIEQWGTICLGYLVKWGVIKNPTPLGPLLMKARTIIRPFTSDRGGMVISAWGQDANGKDVHARWSLLATDDDGPFVPILPMAAAIRKLLDGKIKTGAMIADEALTLSDIEVEMKHHNITTNIELL